jgi:hypothetical protein
MSGSIARVPSHVPHAIHLPRALVQPAWFAAGLVLSFLIPFVFSSTLDVRHDLYYLVYFAGTLAFLAAYVVATGVDLRAVVARSWRWSLLLGAALAVLLVVQVFREDSTPRPDGAYFAFSLAWRGVIYGAVDALLLTAFPALVTLALLGGNLHGAGRRLTFALGSLVLTITITAVYHLGYEQYREDGLGDPEIGNTLISLPTLLTANPLGSVVAHASMHVAADIHAYEGDRIPPQTFVQAQAPADPNLAVAVR